MTRRASLWKRIRWRYSHWTWENFKKQFQVVEGVPHYEREQYFRENHNEIGYQDESDRMSVPIDEGWNKVRDWTAKGLSGGLISALTLAGSQVYSAGLDQSVFWLIMIFISGLGVLMLRQLVLIRHAYIDRSGSLSDYAADRPFAPPPYLMKAARLCDFISVFILIGGFIQGIEILYSLTQPVAITGICG
jgi:hypothetical protein